MSTATHTPGYTDAELVKMAPAVGSKRASPNMSDRYQFINTLEVIDVLRDNGFVPTQLRQQGQILQRKVHRDPRFQEHMVVLTHKDYLRKTWMEHEDGAPQILLYNNHNGRQRFRARFGYYRFVCSNGLIIGDEYLSSVITHAGDAALNIIEHVQRLAAASEAFLKHRDSFFKIKLDDKEQARFAREALELRNLKGKIEPELLLVPRRPEDNKPDLWHVFNRVQENITKGGAEGKSASGRKIRLSPIKGIASDTHLQQSLWVLAEKTAERLTQH